MKSDQYFDSGFEDADKYNDAKVLINSLEIQQVNPILHAIRKKTYARLRLNTGDEALDVGCGIGETAREMSLIVGNSCKVTGIDKSTALLAESFRRTDFSKSNVAYVQCDAANLMFSEATFSFVYAERVLMHTPDPLLVLSEMIRVLKAGCVIAVTEPDLDTVEIYPDYKGISRQVVNQWCRYTESPSVGRQLLGYFQKLGLHNIEVTVNSLKINNYEELEEIRSIKKLILALVGNNKISFVDAEMYSQGLTTASACGKFMFYVNVYSISAQK